MQASWEAESRETKEELLTQVLTIYIFSIF